MNLINTICAYALILMIGTAALFGAAQLVTPGLPACPTEDSTNCVWDAQEQGNGLGTSFVDIDGTLYTQAP